MAWLRFDDNWNRKPEIRALDDATYRAFQCLIEAAEHFDRCGTVTDDYAMAVYPHVRRKLRGRVRDLADRGLVHLPDSADDYQPNCPTCQVRRTETMKEVGTEAVQKHPLSASTSARSGRTEVMVICIRFFYEVAMTPEAKREKRHKDAERQQRKRARDKADPSRRDAEPPSRPPVPVPVPKLKINDLPPPTKELEPASTADPSTPSELVPWLIKELTARRKHIGCQQPRWKDEHREQLEAVVRKARKAPGDTREILNGALDGFFADPAQLKFRYSPHGLAHGFDTHAADVLEQEAKAFNAQKRAKRDAELAAMDAAILAKDAEKKAAQRAEPEAKRNGQGPMAVAELMRSIGGEKL